MKFFILFGNFFQYLKKNSGYVFPLFFVGIIVYIWLQRQKFILLLVSIGIVRILLSIFFVLIGKLAVLFLMRSCFRLYMCTLGGWRDYLWVYSSTDIIKYLPGGFWALLGRVVYYKNSGLTIPLIQRIIFAENIGIILAGLTVGLTLIELYLSIVNVTILLGILIVFFFLGTYLALSHPKRIFFKKNNFILIAINSIVLMMFGWIFIGTSFFLLLPGSNSLREWFWLVGSYLIAFVTGMVAIFAPAGIGIREGILMLMGKYVNVEIKDIFNAAIFSRIIWFVADISLFFCAYLLRNKK